jgi:hypothetical protein
MPSGTSENPWDFGPVLNFLHAFPVTRPSATSKLAQDDASPSASKSSEDTVNEAPTSPHLGNFDAIFKAFSVSGQLTQPKIEPLSEVPSLSEADTTPSTSSPDHDAHHFEDFIRTKEVRWQDEVEATVTTPTPSRKHGVKGRASKRGLDLHQVKVLFRSDEPLSDNDEQPTLEKSIPGRPQSHHSSLHEPRSSDQPNLTILQRRRKSRTSTSRSRTSNGELESETDNQATHQKLLRAKRASSVRDDVRVVTSSASSKPAFASSKHLTPAWVTPLRSQTQSISTLPLILQVPNSVIPPIAYLTREEKRANIIRILKEKLGPDSLKDIDISEVMSQYGGNEADDGLHVFVDSSNILIGFYESLKLARGINKKAITRRAPFSFTSLAFIMERGRGVARRVLVGSTNQSGIIPDYMLQAARCGYEVNSLERVEKYKDEYASGKYRRNHNASGSGSETPYKDEQILVRNRRYRVAYGSGSETPYYGTKKVTEQGVDEILHMKMLESMIDAKRPSTMVLATGDAAEAEYSAGFLRNIERALKKGWRVELVAWRHSMSNAYKSGSFLEKWKGRFSVLELDDFTEDLLAQYVVPSLLPSGDW